MNGLTVSYLKFVKVAGSQGPAAERRVDAKSKFIGHFSFTSNTLVGASEIPMLHVYEIHKRNIKIGFSLLLCRFVG